MKFIVKVLYYSTLLERQITISKEYDSILDLSDNFPPINIFEFNYEIGSIISIQIIPLISK